MGAFRRTVFTEAAEARKMATAAAPSGGVAGEESVVPVSEVPVSEGATLEGFRERILSTLRTHYPDFDLTRTIRALDQAESLHRGQRRQSGEPYLHHPLRIALEAAELGLDPDTAIVALLHDTLEDTSVSMDDLRRDYGELAQVVDGLTKISASEARGFERGKAQTYYKMLVSSVRDIRTLVVKLLDRLDNMRSLGALSRDKQRRIAQETVDIYMPIAARLGLGAISRELAQLGFQYLYPKRYARALRTIEKGRDTERARAESLRVQLTEALRRHDLAGEAWVRWRGVEDHLYADHMAPSVLAGVTVRVEADIDVYATLGAVHECFRAVPGHIRDFVSNPRPNGYRALLTQVNVEGEVLELEIVSRAMEVVNEKGMLADWSKDPGSLSDFYLHYLNLLETLTVDDELRVEDVRNHVLPDSLHVFSPEGDSFNFPRGATCLDFAYRIHSTEVGDRARGAVIRGEVVELSHRLTDGDVVEIQVAPDVIPTEQWLEWTVTARAQTAIRRVLKQRRRVRAREVGLDLLRREMSRYGLDLDDLDPAEVLAPVLETRHVEFDELLAQVGFRREDVTALVRDLELCSPEGKRLRRADQPSFLGRLLGWRMPPPRPDFTVHHVNDAFVRMAGCCHPVLGERVVGYLTADTGISLHHRGCEKLGKLDPAGLVSIDWDPAAVPPAVELHVVADNHPGMITRITKVISDGGVNIDDLSIATDGDGGHIRLILGGVDLASMRLIAETLRGIKGVARFWQES